ncbi:Translocase subunit seca [Melia azedarach]|uniref:Translocase subunit seca n=1 Tax=Melia azedarach TaxID=155640 RepID=A0ACC1XR48_MELAZ|nr:Translocase subunit seca [Melia azedarach]
MNRCAYQQRNAMGGGYEEERRLDSMICPKPRRLGLLNPSINDPIRPLRWSANQQSEIGDSKAGTELLDIILTKGGGYGAEKSGNQVASSPPYFCGSPPSRSSNPLIQDAQFGKEKLTPLSPAPPSPSSRMGGGCVRVKYGHKPAAVRIEGFDCLSRDRRNCSISAVA